MYQLNLLSYDSSSDIKVHTFILLSPVYSNTIITFPFFLLVDIFLD